MRRLRAKASGKATGTLQERVDALERENEELRGENMRLRAELGKYKDLQIDVDEFARTGRQDTESGVVEQESRSLAALAHAQATQRAVTFYSLEHMLMTQAHAGAQSHLVALEGQIAHLKLHIRRPLLRPLQARIARLERKIAAAKAGEDRTRELFAVLRERTIKSVVSAVRVTMQGFLDAFERLDAVDLAALVDAAKRLGDAHELCESEGMAELQRNGASREEAGELGFLEQLYAIAGAVKAPLGRWLESIGESVGDGAGRVEVQMGKLKGLERVFEKAMEEYEGDFSRLGDIVRGSLVCDDPKGVVAVLDALSARCKDWESDGVIEALRVLRIKNRLDPLFDAETEGGGYRDVLVNLAVGVRRETALGGDGGAGGLDHQGDKLLFLACEVQLHLRSFHDIKGAGGAHKLYKQARSLHLLDKELGQLWVHGGEDEFDEAMAKVESGGCAEFRADFFPLEEPMAVKLRDALLDRTACSVTELSLQSASLSNVADVFAGHAIQGLHLVDLSHNDGVRVSTVTALLSKSTRTLRVHQCGLRGDEVEAILRHLHDVGARSLRSLDLSRNGIRANGAELVGPPLAKLTSVTTLNLNFSELGSAGVAVLAPHLKFLTNLRTLHLQENDLGPDGAATLGEVLPALVNLDNLNLQANKFGSEGAAAIAPGLEKMPCLATFSFQENFIGSEGAIALAPALMKLNLRSLVFGVNHIGSEGAVAIAPVLQAKPQLQRLILGDNLVGCQGAVALAPALKCLANVTYLNLQRNDIGSEGAAVIAPGLQCMVSLNRLNLEANKLGSEGAAAVCPALKALTKLEELVMDNNGLTEADEQLVRANIPAKCTLKAL